MALFASKNTSPRQLAFFASLTLAFIVALLSLFFTQVWYWFLSVLGTVFICAYCIFYYTLKYFIYRKIKLIYKIIYQTKATKRETFFYQKILPQKSIEEVNRDVERWASEKRGEIELLQKNEQFRKEFLQNLSHELRTPIFTIQGYIHSVLEDGTADAQLREKFLQNADKGVQRLVNLVDDLDQISKLELGQELIHEEVFIIQNVVKEVFEELALKAEKNKISLQVKKGTEIALRVRADKGKIKRVLINLVDNAIKYGKTGGHIVIGCYQMDEQHVYIEVSDDGIGIPEQHLSRIFERFYRVDKSRNRQVGGTGLGLAIVKHIIEAHGQTINVRSHPEVGSSFGFTLAKASE
ncbi:MAG TPA: ATP-binding protein [Edaphocola sp.]|nr:ATP-binding protein [Edaphocola sp.]